MEGGPENPRGAHWLQAKAGKTTEQSWGVGRGAAVLLWRVWGGPGSPSSRAEQQGEQQPERQPSAAKHSGMLHSEPQRLSWKSCRVGVGDADWEK